MSVNNRFILWSSTVGYPLMKGQYIPGWKDRNLYQRRLPTTGIILRVDTTGAIIR